MRRDLGWTKLIPRASLVITRDRLFAQHSDIRCRVGATIRGCCEYTTRARHPECLGVARGLIIASLSHVGLWVCPSSLYGGFCVFAVVTGMAHIMDYLFLFKPEHRG